MKKILTVLSLAAVLIAGIYAVMYSYNNLEPTYESSETDVVELYEDPDDYDVSEPEGVAEVIVAENLEKTRAANNVAAVVFDFRGFDTLGESFILLTAIAGTFVILGTAVKKKEEKEDDAA